MKCYCCSEKEFSHCCEPYLKGQSWPPQVESLMRSRYSAFCCQEMEYVFSTTDAQVRYEFDLKGNTEWAQAAQFVKLDILKSEENGNKGLVEFKAYYKINGQDHVHHELSTFRKHQGQWFYRSGKVFQ